MGQPQILLVNYYSVVKYSERDFSSKIPVYSLLQRTIPAGIYLQLWPSLVSQWFISLGISQSEPRKIGQGCRWSNGWRPRYYLVVSRMFIRQYNQEREIGRERKRERKKEWRLTGVRREYNANSAHPPIIYFISWGDHPRDQHKIHVNVYSD